MRRAKNFVEVLAHSLIHHSASIETSLAAPYPTVAIPHSPSGRQARLPRPTPSRMVLDSTKPHAWSLFDVVDRVCSATRKKYTSDTSLTNTKLI